MTLLTPQEKRVVLFLIASVLLGAGIRIYRSQNPSFAPELRVRSEGTKPEPSPRVEHVISRRKIDLNTASKAELESLPGIGPVFAQRILAYRKENGAFRRKEDLMKVKGIALTRYRDLEPYIKVGPPTHP